MHLPNYIKNRVDDEFNYLLQLTLIKITMIRNDKHAKYEKIMNFYDIFTIDFNGITFDLSKDQINSDSKIELDYTKLINVMKNNLLHMQLQNVFNMVSNKFKEDGKIINFVISNIPINITSRIESLLLNTNFIY